MTAGWADLARPELTATRTIPQRGNPIAFGCRKSAPAGQHAD